MMNSDKLKGHLPAHVIEQVEKSTLIQSLSPLRLAHFLAQCHHESAGFVAAEENLNYSYQGLNKVFGKYFKTVSADNYARKPEKIGSHVYANRMGNGDEASKDGYKYRGRGYIQLTGRENYLKFGLSIGVDLIANPDLVATDYPLESAAWFFTKNELWNICDRGAKDLDVQAVTKRVNGGKNGLEDRILLFKRYFALLS